MKAVVAAFNQEKVLVGAFYVITNLRMEIFEALTPIITLLAGNLGSSGSRDEAVWRKTEEIFEEFFSDNS